MLIPLAIVVCFSKQCHPLLRLFKCRWLMEYLCGSRFTEARGFRGAGRRRVKSGVYWAAINQGTAWLSEQLSCSVLLLVY